MQGVVVATDKHQQWLLPWWWSHYSNHNTFPVAFIDFGLSSEAVQWVKNRGIYVDMTSFNPHEFVIPPTNPDIKAKWESLFTPAEYLWTRRLSWFIKPFACLHSPFLHSVWIDLDCEVRNEITPLFNSLQLGTEIALTRHSKTAQEMNQDLGIHLPEEINYSSGVIAFQKCSEIITYWVEETIRNNEQFIGDQESLSRAILVKKPLLLELPSEFNWLLGHGTNDHAVIHHYHGSWKQQIMEKVKRDPNLNLFVKQHNK